VHTYIHIHIYIHTCTHVTHIHVWFGREHTRRTERNTSRPHFQFVSVYLKNGERNPRSPLFQAYRRICEKKDHSATRDVTFSPFHTLFQNFREKSTQRISLPEVYDILNTILLIQLYYVFYRYKSDLCHRVHLL